MTETKEFTNVNVIPSTRNAVNELKGELFKTDSATQNDVIEELIRQAGYSEVLDDE